jgi:hypothetical protein
LLGVSTTKTPEEKPNNAELDIAISASHLSKATPAAHSSNMLVADSELICSPRNFSNKQIKPRVTNRRDFGSLEQLARWDWQYKAQNFFNTKGTVGLPRKSVTQGGRRPKTQSM